jgi:glycosyltransferase involved in cell wall biosynthesis
MSDVSRKLIIQIPCYNEESTLAVALADLPREVPGFTAVEWLIIDDGCEDRTVEVALENGVDHVVRMGRNQGLAKGFMAGIEACLKLGADVIVNTDADNQYDGSCIPALTQPIVNGEADMVVGARPISDIQHFSPIKKMLQKLGSWAVRVASNAQVPDAPSGFRAISRELAMRLNVFNAYTYTLETLIQAGRNNFRVTSVPVNVNEDLRPSRLVKSIPSYVRRSMGTIFRVFLIYKPFRAFTAVSIILLALAGVLGVRFLYSIYFGGGGEHIQSLILAAILSMAAFTSFAVGIIADLLAVNRLLLEDIRFRLRQQELDTNRNPTSAKKS